MKYYFLNHSRRDQYLSLIGDTVLLFLSIFISYGIRIYLNGGNVSTSAIIHRLHPLHMLAVVFPLLFLYIFDQYESNKIISSVRTALTMVFSMLMGAMLTSAFLFFAPKYIMGRQVVVIFVIAASFLIVTWRYFLFFVVIQKKARTRRLAAVGDGHTVSMFIEDLDRLPSNGFVINNICLLNGNRKVTCRLGEHVNVHHDVSGLMSHGDFDVLAYDSTRGVYSSAEISEILKLKYNGKEVYDLSKLYEHLTGKVPLAYIDGSWFLKHHSFQGAMSKSYAKLKRVIDVTLAGLGLLITSPLLVLIAGLVKADSEGAIFFFQERLGLQRRPFRCVKFRTMIKDAESKSGPKWSSEDDPRITRVGRILRKTRLDELPQLLNIFKGEMTFVGPRPIRQHFADLLAEQIPFYALRFNVKPGLTGWAQVNHDYAGSEEGQLEKFQYELFYISNMSLFLDVFIMFKTLKTVFKRTGL